MSLFPSLPFPGITWMTSYISRYVFQTIQSHSKPSNHIPNHPILFQTSQSYSKPSNLIPYIFPFPGITWTTSYISRYVFQIGCAAILMFLPFVIVDWKLFYLLVVFFMLTSMIVLVDVYHTRAIRGMTSYKFVVVVVAATPPRYHHHVITSFHHRHVITPSPPRYHAISTTSSITNDYYHSIMPLSPRHQHHFIDTTSSTPRH
jgi:hypothetical protein